MYFLVFFSSSKWKKRMDGKQTFWKAHSKIFLIGHLSIWFEAVSPSMKTYRGLDVFRRLAYVHQTFTSPVVLFMNMIVFNYFNFLISSTLLSQEQKQNTVTQKDYACAYASDYASFNRFFILKNYLSKSLIEFLQTSIILLSRK